MQVTAALPSSSSGALPWSRLGDETLASRAAAGNKAAFGALYERYHGPLLGYCRSILLNAEDAADATQNALENALRSLPRREPGRPLKPWLYRIAHNEAINIVRRRQPHASEVEIDNLLSVPGPEVDAEQRTRLSQLVDDLRALPERQRGALVMRELSGLSYDEIGLALGISNEAARRAVFDARTALHDAVDGRATACVSVRHCLSDGDRRSVRARRIRAHLRSCDDCASFQRAIGVRRQDLHLLGPWLPGAGIAGIVGLGAGTAGGGALLATSGGASVGLGGGLGWASLPAAVKGIAVAAAVATTGTAAVGIEKAATPGRPGPRTALVAEPSAAQSARVASLPAATPRSITLRARRNVRAALAQAGVSAAAGAATSTIEHRDTTAALQSQTAADGAPAATAPARVAPPANMHAPTAAPRQPSPTPRASKPVARTPEQVAIDKLTAIQDQIRRAVAAAQATAAAGGQGALQTAQTVLQDVLASLRPAIDRVLATVGLTLPAPAATGTQPAASQPAPTPTNLLAPVQQVLSGVDSLLQKLFGHG